MASAIFPPPILTEPVFWAAIGTGAGAFLFFRGFALLQRERLILNTPRSTVRAAAMGLVEVSGKALGPYMLISPLSLLNCYYYRVVAWQSKNRYWTKVAEEILYAPLFLDDGTGRLLLDPRTAEVDVSAPFSQEYANSRYGGEFMPDYIRHFLYRHGIASENPLKLEEYCIVPGDTLFVLGTLQHNARVEEVPAQDGVATRRFVPSFVSQEAADLQRRGMLERIDSVAGQSLASEENAHDPFDLQPEVILAKGRRREPFFISWRSEREVVLATRWNSFLYLWVGPAVMLACLWALLARLR